MINALGRSLQTVQRTIRWAALACLPVALAGLSACGGAADPATSVIPQSISFPATGALTFSAPPLRLTAAATSGLPVSYSSSTPAVCAVNGDTLIIQAAGSCTITANQAGDLTYAAAAPVVQSINVARAAQSITLVAPGNQTLGAGTVTLMGSASSGLPLSFMSATPTVCTANGNVLSLLSAGRCQVDAQQAGNGNYLPAPTVAASFDVSVVLQSQTISFPALGNQVLGGTAISLAATATSNLPVSFMSLTPSVCAVGGVNLTLLSAGTCTVAASQPGNGVFAAAATVVNSLGVSAAPQTISFATPAAQTLGTPAAALVATASSGLPVSFASTTTAVCTVSGANLTLVAAGTCSITASQPGNSSFSAAAPVVRSFSVQAAAQTISFASPGNQTLGTTPPALLATASSGLPVLLVSTTPSVCSVSGTTLTLIAVGTCSVEARQAGNANVAAATPVVRAFTVTAAGPAAQTISFPQPANQTLGTGPVALVATASSGLPVSFASTTPSTCSVNGSTLTLLAVGSCIVDASQAGNASFNPAVSVTRVIAITAPALTAQTISFTAPGNQTLGAGPVTLVATASSGLPVSFASTTPSTCSVSGNMVSLLAVGSCIVDASQAGNASFAPAATVTRTFSIGPATQTIAFSSPGSQTLGTMPPVLVATASSGLAVSLVSNTPATCTVSGNTLSLLAAGTCSITATQAGNASFQAAPAVTVSFNISAAPLSPQTISFPSPGPQTFGSGPVALVATATSGLPVSFASSTPAVCMVSGNSLSLLAAGVCVVTATQDGNSSFAGAAAVSNSFNVLPGAQSVSFSNPGNQILGTGPVGLAATASSGLAVSFSSTTPGVCTVSGNSATLLAAGLCSITASQVGNANFLAATPVTQSFTVGLAGQTISFASPGTQTLLTAPPALSATASSGLPVVFSTATPAVCTVSGSTLTLVAAGTCTINANQGGGGNFGPAPTVSQSFTVNKAAQTISFTSPGDQTLRIATPAVSASASSGLAVGIASTTPAVCTVSGSALTLVAAGTCTLQATQAGDATFAAATQLVSFAVLKYELFANGGFETAGTTTPAEGWLPGATGYSRSTDARTGQFSARLASPAINAAVVLQNSIEQGMRLPLEAGSVPTLTFWAKGQAGGTGNVLFALRYLDGTGNILASSNNQFFQTQINPSTWTQITYTLPGGVPAGAVAAFIEISQAIGPIEPGLVAGEVLIDDLSLK